MEDDALLEAAVIAFLMEEITRSPEPSPVEAHPPEVPPPEPVGEC